MSSQTERIIQFIDKNLADIKIIKTKIEDHPMFRNTDFSNLDSKILEIITYLSQIENFVMEIEKTSQLMIKSLNN
jgi:hypothetical protein